MQTLSNFRVKFTLNSSQVLTIVPLNFQTSNTHICSQKLFKGHAMDKIMMTVSDKVGNVKLLLHVCFNFFIFYNIIYILYTV